MGTGFHKDTDPMTPRRAAWFALGAASLALGALGAALPLLPTTPLVLFAAFAFARSSDRWHDWLLRHRTFGPIIADWRAHGAVARPAKAVGTISMVGVFGLSLAMGAAPIVLIAQALILIAAAAFILTRPAPPGE